MKVKTKGLPLICLMALMCAFSSAPAAVKPQTDKVAAYIEQLQSEDAEAVGRAITGLGRLSDPRAQDALIGLLGTCADPKLLSMALGYIRFREHPEAADPVIELLQKNEQAMRSVVDQALELAMPTCVERVMPFLKDPDPWIRVQAASALARSHIEEAVDVLIAALKDPSPELRARAAQGLACARSAKVVDPLLEMTRDPDGRVRQAAMASLAMKKDPRLFDLFSDLALHGESEAIRWAAVRGLMEMRDPRAVPILMKVLKDEGPEAAQMIEEHLYYEGAPDAVPALIEALNDRSSLVRHAALRALSNTRDPRVIEVMKKLLKDEDQDVRQAAESYVFLRTMTPVSLQDVEGFGGKYARAPRPAQPRTAQEALKLLRSPNPIARSMAVRMLGRTRDPKVAGPIIVVLKDPYLRIRDEAAVALGRINDPASARKIAAMLRPPGKNTISAARALQRMRRGLTALGPVSELLKSKDPGLRRMAVVVLGDMDTPKVIPLLKPMLKDPKVRNTTIDALGRIGGPEAAKVLVPLLREKTGLISGEGSSYQMEKSAGVWPVLSRIGDKSIVPDVIPVLKDADPTRRANAARVLGALKDPRAIDALTPLLKDRSEDVHWSPVCETAVEALGDIGDPKALPALFEAVMNPKCKQAKAVESIGKIKGEQAVAFLEGLLDNPSARAAGAAPAAMKALGGSGDKRAVKPLVRMLTSSFHDYIAAAAEALGRLGDPSAADDLVPLMNDVPEAAVALGTLGDKRAVEPLLEMLGDPRQNLDVANALAGLKDERAREPLMREYRTFPAGSVIVALAQLGDMRIAGDLLKLFWDEDPRTARAAIRAAGMLKVRSAIPELIIILENDHIARNGGALSDLEFNPDQEDTGLIAYYSCSPDECDYRSDVRQALASITGQDFGEDPGAWLKWWRSQPKEKAK